MSHCRRRIDCHHGARGLPDHRRYRGVDRHGARAGFRQYRPARPHTVCGRAVFRRADSRHGRLDRHRRRRTPDAGRLARVTRGQTESRQRQSKALIATDRECSGLLILSRVFDRRRRRFAPLTGSTDRKRGSRCDQCRPATTWTLLLFNLRNDVSDSATNHHAWVRRQAITQTNQTKHQSPALTPADLMIGHHLSSSALWWAARACGFCWSAGNMTWPRASIFARAAGWASAATTAASRRSTTALGVSLVVHKPCPTEMANP